MDKKKGFIRLTLVVSIITSLLFLWWNYQYGNWFYPSPNPNIPPLPPTLPLGKEQPRMFYGGDLDYSFYMPWITKLLSLVFGFTVIWAIYGLIRWVVIGIAGFIVRGFVGNNPKNKRG